MDLFSFDTLFWIGASLFFTLALMLILRGGPLLGNMYYLQVLGGLCMFVGSKIGRSFLGLA